MEVESQKIMENGFSLNRRDADTSTKFHAHGSCLVEDSVDHHKTKQNCTIGMFR